MTQIQILNTKRTNNYLELSYKMSFILPAVFGTGANPIVGLDKILYSYGIYQSEIIPVTGTVLTFYETVSILSSLTLPQIETALQTKYSTIRTALDGITLIPSDNLAGLSFDGTTWASSASITDLPIVNLNQSNLSATITAATGIAATLTLPAVVSKFHNITYIEITAYSTAARTGIATPIIVTTTNLPTSNAFTFATAAAIGTTDVKILIPPQPIKSAVANTATTIVCPATVGIIWRLNVFYNT